MIWQDVQAGAQDLLNILPVPSSFLAFEPPQAILANPGVFDTGAPSCPHPQLSCHNTSIVEDLCCFNAPGGQMLQTQFWDTNPPTGPSDIWTMHGLWPDRCDGSYEAYCDDSRSYSNVTAILQSYNATALLDDMSLYWKDYQGHDSNLWKHEWQKHGTCISTLAPKCYADAYKSQIEVVDYFQSAVSLYKTLPSYEWLLQAGIEPSTSQTYARDDITAALTAHHGKPVTIRCRGGQLDEIWYHFDVKGSVQTGSFVAADPDGAKTNCPRSGIRYLRKKSHQPTTSRSHSVIVPGPTGTPGKPFEGKGNLMVEVDREGTGCLISGGTWYVSGTCAGFTSTITDDGVQLASRKGNCSIVKDGALKCAASNKEATTFSHHGSILNKTFFAEKLPKGFHQVPVYNEEKDHAIELKIKWQGI